MATFKKHICSKNRKGQLSNQHSIVAWAYNLMLHAVVNAFKNFHYTCFCCCCTWNMTSGKQLSFLKPTARPGDASCLRIAPCPKPLLLHCVQLTIRSRHCIVWRLCCCKYFAFMHFLFVQRHCHTIVTNELALNLTSKGQAHQHSYHQAAARRKQDQSHTPQSSPATKVTLDGANNSGGDSIHKKLQTLMTAITENKSSKNNETLKHWKRKATWTLINFISELAAPRSESNNAQQLQQLRSIKQQRKQQSTDSSQQSAFSAAIKLKTNKSIA